MPAKRSESGPGEKLLTLYTLLMVQGGRALSLGELANFLACSKQTIKRLLGQLEASKYGKLDAAIVKERKHYYRLAPITSRQLNIGVEELMQLSLCRNMLMQILPKGVSKLLGQAATQESSPLDTTKPLQKDASVSNVGQVYHKGYIDYAPFTEQYASLLQSIRKQKVCIVTYKRGPATDARTFSFAPKRLVSYRETLSFVGYEVGEKGSAHPKYDNHLALYLQRCLDVKMTTRSSERVPEPIYAQGDSEPSAFGTMPGEAFNVRILFTKETAPYIYDRTWSNRQEMTLQDDGSLILDFDAQSFHELISWILSFGAKAKVLGPEWLKEEIKNQLSESYKKY